MPHFRDELCQTLTFLGFSRFLFSGALVSGSSSTGVSSYVAKTSVQRAVYAAFIFRTY